MGIKKFLARVIITFDTTSKLDWVLLWLMVYLTVLTVAQMA